MRTRESYMPGPAAGAEVRKQGDHWTLTMVRDLHHPPGRVWQALTDPVQLKEWSPFDADKDLTSSGPVRLTTFGAPGPHVTETRVVRAEAPRRLEFDWGGQEIRWELEPQAGGTRLTLRHDVDRRFISLGAAGWHVCLDVLDCFLAGEPIGRMAGPETMKFSGWQRLNTEYAKQFGVEMPKW